MATRSVFLEASRRGETVWSVLCQVALHGIEWAAKVWNATDVAERIERVELLVENRAHPVTMPCQAVDWAKLTETQRVLVAREVGRQRGAR